MPRSFALLRPLEKRGESEVIAKSKAIGKREVTGKNFRQGAKTETKGVAEQLPEQFPELPQLSARPSSGLVPAWAMRSVGARNRLVAQRREVEERSSGWYRQGRMSLGPGWARQSLRTLRRRRRADSR